MSLQTSQYAATGSLTKLTEGAFVSQCMFRRTSGKIIRLSASHQAVMVLGGEPAKGITKKLDYLIIGSVGSEFWRHSSFGSKIVKAAQYREEGVPISIVGEAHWVSRLMNLG